MTPLITKETEEFLTDMPAFPIPGDLTVDDLRSMLGTGDYDLTVKEKTRVWVNGNLVLRKERF